MLENLIWFLSHLLDPWKNFCLQIFFINGRGYPEAPFNPNRSNLLPVWCYASKHRDWGWMLGCLHSAVFRSIIFKCWDPIILFAEDKINDDNFFHIKIRIQFSWFYSSSHATNGCSIQQIITELNGSFVERLRLIPLIILTIVETGETEIFFSCSSLVIFRHGLLT